MRRSTSLVVALETALVAFTLIACGSSPGGPSSTPPPTQGGGGQQVMSVDFPVLDGGQGKITLVTVNIATHTVVFTVNGPQGYGIWQGAMLAGASIPSAQEVASHGFGVALPVPGSASRTADGSNHLYFAFWFTAKGSLPNWEGDIMKRPPDWTGSIELKGW